MGTSSARRGPTTGLWRAAKGAATRYLSPGAGGEVSAQEVVSPVPGGPGGDPGAGGGVGGLPVYPEGGSGPGGLGAGGGSPGLGGGPGGAGSGTPGRGPPELLAPGVAGVLAGSGGGLEEAVVRTALALVWGRQWQSRDRVEPAELVRQFLITAVHLRLALDLGEPLEAAAGSYGRLRDGLSRIKALIEAGASAADAAPPAPPDTPGHWQGLAGWTWVTEVLAGLLKNLG